MTPINAVIQIETDRLRLGIKKKELCKRAGIKPEMYSYLLKRGKLGFDLPVECVGKVKDALRDMKQRKIA